MTESRSTPVEKTAEELSACFLEKKGNLNIWGDHHITGIKEKGALLSFIVDLLQGNQPLGNLGPTLNFYNVDFSDDTFNEIYSAIVPTSPKNLLVILEIDLLTEENYGRLIDFIGKGQFPVNFTLRLYASDSPAAQQRAGRLFEALREEKQDQFNLELYGPIFDKEKTVLQLLKNSAKARSLTLSGNRATPQVPLGQLKGSTTLFSYCLYPFIRFSLEENIFLEGLVILTCMEYEVQEQIRAMLKRNRGFKNFFLDDLIKNFDNRFGLRPLQTIVYEYACPTPKSFDQLKALGQVARNSFHRNTTCPVEQKDGFERSYAIITDHEIYDLVFFKNAPFQKTFQQHCVPFFRAALKKHVQDKKNLGEEKACNSADDLFLHQVEEFIRAATLEVGLQADILNRLIADHEGAYFVKEIEGLKRKLAQSSTCRLQGERTGPVSDEEKARPYDRLHKKSYVVDLQGVRALFVDEQEKKGHHALAKKIQNILIEDNAGPLECLAFLRNVQAYFPDHKALPPRAALLLKEQAQKELRALLKTLSTSDGAVCYEGLITILNDTLNSTVPITEDALERLIWFSDTAHRLNCLKEAEMCFPGQYTEGHQAKLYQARDGLFKEGALLFGRALGPAEGPEGLQLLNKTLRHAAAVIECPSSTVALKALVADSHEMASRPDCWKLFLGATLFLGGVIVMGLGLAGALHSAGLSLFGVYAGKKMVVSGCASMAVGLGFYFWGKQRPAIAKAAKEVCSAAENAQDGFREKTTWANHQGAHALDITFEEGFTYRALSGPRGHGALPLQNVPGSVRAR